MKYKSTRDGVHDLSFEDAVLSGLADDGGLLVPNEFPRFTLEELESLRSSSFQEVSFATLSKFIEEEIPKSALQELIERSYQTFRHPEISPVIEVGNVHILELFHGPTFAFKDVALQFLGNLFEYFLKKREQRLTVLGATSGDTGSAAIYGLRGKENIDVFMLFPEGRVSPIQELQMTSVLDDNVHCLGIEGTFDDAQNIVKALFRNLHFKKKYALGAVNSINFARILAQIVYYVYAWLHTAKGEQEVSFSVPTGNFGDILAGYYAKKMGLPIQHLIVATNQNDILDRFFTSGEYHQKHVMPTWSPSMDIQISSNFERFLFDICEEDGKTIRAWMENFQETQKLTVSGSILQKAQQEMLSASVSQEETLSTIQRYYQEFDYLLDPHTAVGVKATERWMHSSPMICLATAHPAKFTEAIQESIGSLPELPETLHSLQDQPTKKKILSAEEEVIQKYIMQISSLHK